MEISKTCNLLLSDLFYYDFKACCYSILKSIGWDLRNIDYENKEKRNIQIGLLQRDNPKLSKFILETTIGLVDSYIENNNLTKDNIILRARDGFITNKKLKIINETMPIDLRILISKLIITIDRKKILMIEDKGIVEVKGFSGKPIDISFYDLFRNLNFSTKKGLIIGLESIRNSILNSKNTNWFVKMDSDGNYLLPILGEGILKMNKTMINMIDTDEIDKHFIWEEFVWPFAQSILVHLTSTDVKGKK